MYFLYIYIYLVSIYFSGILQLYIQKNVFTNWVPSSFWSILQQILLFFITHWEQDQKRFSKINIKDCNFFRPPPPPPLFVF